MQLKTYAERFVKLATEMAETAGPERRKELLEIARICSKVPYEPAETFAEAVQSVWFIQCILQIESNGHSLSYGRFDQYISFCKRLIWKQVVRQKQVL